MYQVLAQLGIEKHTPHDCRHTFSKFCELYHVNENDRKRMLGHSFGNDVTNRVYGHRDLKDLKMEIEKIDKRIFCDFIVTNRPQEYRFFLKNSKGWRLKENRIKPCFLRGFRSISDYFKTVKFLSYF